MITTHEKMRLPDEDGKNHWALEVNWNPEDARTNECKIIRATAPNGEKSFIKREYFHSFLFAISKAEDQQKLVPQIIKKVHSKETVFQVVATKDIRKGEPITFAAKVDFDCPYYKQEVLSTPKVNKV